MKKIFLSNLIAFIAIFIGSIYVYPNLAPEKSKNIKHISVKNKSLLDKKGRMYRRFLRQLLKQAYQENKLPNPEFKDPEKLEIDKLAEAEKEAPWGATQLFSVKTPNQSYIVKGIKNKEEIDDLINSVNVDRILGFIYPNTNYQYPQFIFPVAYFSYTDQHNNKHYLSLMPTAPGKSLSDLLKEYVKNPDNPQMQKNVAQAYFYVGRAMANFYQRTNNKISHGDLHHGNIFYAPKNHQVSLIDNERIAKSSKNADMCEESAFLLLKSLFVVQWTNPKLIQSLKKIGLEKWYRLFLPAYIAGYISAYPKNQRKKIFVWLKKCIVTYKSPEDKLHWYTDKKILGFDHKKYMGPVFNSLEISNILFDIEPQTINQKDKNGKTLLHKAALKGEFLLIWPLIALGAEIDVRDYDLNTPLHEASYENHPRVIKILINAGANIFAQDRRGHIPLEKAQFNSSNEAIKILKPYGIPKKEKLAQNLKDLSSQLKILSTNLKTS